MKFLNASGVTDLVTRLKTRFQEKLISGTNIKTINNNSILGSGNIAVSNLQNIIDGPNDSIIEGDVTNNTAGGSFSHAEGNGTTASGLSAHSEGGFTNASTSGAHAEGGYTRAIGVNAHAEGLQTTASGHSAHAGGQYTIANQDAQTAIGKNNATLTNGLFLVGNGASTSSRSNAFYVDSSGNAVASNNIIGDNIKSKGGPTQPVYFDANGIAKSISYTIAKSVPSNAVFTDNNTTYADVTTSTHGLMTAADKIKLNDIATSATRNTFSAFTGAPTSNQTPNFGDTFIVPQVSQSTSGQISTTSRTVTIPGDLVSTAGKGLVLSYTNPTIPRFFSIYPDHVAGWYNNSNLLASQNAPGLMPQLTGISGHLLHGNGNWGFGNTWNYHQHLSMSANATASANLLFDKDISGTRSAFRFVTARHGASYSFGILFWFFSNASSACTVHVEQLGGNNSGYLTTASLSMTSAQNGNNKQYYIAVRKKVATSLQIIFFGGWGSWDEVSLGGTTGTVSFGLDHEGNVN